MSRENVERVVAAGYEELNREKGPPPDLWLPDGEYINSREDPDHATHRGIEAIRKQHQGWFDAYPDLHAEPVEIRANGNRAFVWVRFSGHGAVSGAPMELEVAHVWTLEGERIRRVEEFFDRDEALEAVGLSE